MNTLLIYSYLIHKFIFKSKMLVLYWQVILIYIVVTDITDVLEDDSNNVKEDWDFIIEWWEIMYLRVCLNFTAP